MTKMMILVGFFCVGLSISFFSTSLTSLMIINPVQAADQGSVIRTQIEEALAQRHPQDTPAWWRALGPDAVPVIIDMISKETSTYHEIRLVEALGWFGNRTESDKLLKEFGSNPKHGTAFQATALKSLVRAEGDEAIEFVSKFLTNDDVQIRYAVAASLQELASSRAQAVLRDYLKGESVAWVETKLRGELPLTKATPAGALKRVATSKDLAKKAAPQADSGTETRHWIGQWRGQIVFTLANEPGADVKGDVKSQVRKVYSSDWSLEIDQALKVTSSFRGCCALVAKQPGVGEVESTAAEKVNASLVEQMNALLIEQVKIASPSVNLRFGPKLLQPIGGLPFGLIADGVLTKEDHVKFIQVRLTGAVRGTGFLVGQ